MGSFSRGTANYVQFTEVKFFKVVLGDKYDIWGSDGCKHLGYRHVGYGADCMVTSQGDRDLKKHEVSPKMLTTTWHTISHF